jgi:hypothetical protein
MAPLLPWFLDVNFCSGSLYIRQKHHPSPTLVSIQLQFAPIYAKEVFLPLKSLMMSLGRLLVAIFSLLCVTVKASRASHQPNRVQVRGDSIHVPTSHLVTPIPPSQDSWYLNPPEGFEFTAPGTILSICNAPGNLSATTASSSAAYNILYRTTNSQYEPTWAVAMLFIPAPAASYSGCYLLSYQIPYGNADVDGSPSYQMYTPDWTPTAISAALGRGWHVLTGDYEDPLASFTAGVMSGHAVLDGVRAVLRGGCASTLGLLPSVKYAVWGYSGGALASEFATELQQDYAPELGFVGAAMGGLTPNATSVRDTVEGTVTAGLIPLWLVGVTSQFPTVRKYVVSKLSPVGDTDELVSKYCSLDASIWYQRNTVGTHGSESGAEDYKAFDFLESVFAGTYSLEGCKIETITDPPS